MRNAALRGAPCWVIASHRCFWAFLIAAPLACGARPGIQILNGDAHFPEGPVWYRGKLYYVEYDRNTVMTWDGSKNAVFSAEKGCGQSAVAPTPRGEFLTTCYDNGSIGRISADGAVLPAYTHDKDGNRFLGPNDLAPDHRGGVYFTASGHLGPVIDGKVFYIARRRDDRPSRNRLAQRQRRGCFCGRNDPVRGGNRGTSSAAIQDRRGWQLVGSARFRRSRRIDSSCRADLAGRRESLFERRNLHRPESTRPAYAAARPNLRARSAGQAAAHARACRPPKFRIWLSVRTRRRFMSWPSIRSTSRLTAARCIPYRTNDGGSHSC